MKPLLKLMVAKDFSVNCIDGAPECLLVTGGVFCQVCSLAQAPVFPVTAGTEHHKPRGVSKSTDLFSDSSQGQPCKGQVLCAFCKVPGENAFPVTSRSLLNPLASCPSSHHSASCFWSPIYFRGQISLYCPLPRSRVIAVRVHQVHLTILNSLSLRQSPVLLSRVTLTGSWRLELWRPRGTGIQPSALCTALVAGDIRYTQQGHQVSTCCSTEIPRQPVFTL